MSRLSESSKLGDVLMGALAGFDLPGTRLAEELQGHPVKPSKLLQFHIVDAALTRFTFRDEGLPSVESRCHFCLGETSLFPGLPETQTKCSIGLLVGAGSQDMASRDAPFVKSQYRLSQNRIC